MSSFEAQRERMVREHIAGRGIRDPRILAAMGAVPRELFVDSEWVEQAYEDKPLPIDTGQTISQPYIVAVMIDALKLSDDTHVLEVGAGSGYAAAVLSRIAQHVDAIEQHGVLVEQARRRIERLGLENISLIHGDGTLGWSARAPYDGIMVSAGGTVIPPPLREQLAIGARLVIPIGPDQQSQQLMLVQRTGENTFNERTLGRVQFVPLAEGGR